MTTQEISTEVKEGIDSPLSSAYEQKDLIPPIAALKTKNIPMRKFRTWGRKDKNRKGPSFARYEIPCGKDGNGIQYKITLKPVYPSKDLANPDYAEVTFPSDMTFPKDIQFIGGTSIYEYLKNSEACRRRYIFEDELYYKSSNEGTLDANLIDKAKKSEALENTLKILEPKVQGLIDTTEAAEKKLKETNKKIEEAEKKLAKLQGKGEK